MAKRKTPTAHAQTRQREAEGVLWGDVREAPVEVRDGGVRYRPLVALWLRPDDGRVVGLLLDKPGDPARTLVQALQAPVPIPGETQKRGLPSKVVLFDPDLAQRTRPLLAPLNIAVSISPPVKAFDDLFAELFATLERGPGAWHLPDVPRDVLKSVVSTAEHLWHAKPWQYAYDDPPFSLLLGESTARPLFASVLGANDEVLGVAFFTSLEDHEAVAALGALESGPPGIESSDAAAEEVLQACRHRVLAVSFEPKDEAPPDYCDLLAKFGWPQRLSTVPLFYAMGGGSEPGPLTPEETADLALAVEALVAFCQKHREQIASEDFPIRETVEVHVLGKTCPVVVQIPGKDPSPPSRRSTG